MIENTKYFIDTAIISNQGIVRDNNEDCGFALDMRVWKESVDNSFGFYIVADGMGGEQAGEVASSKAIDQISRIIRDSWDHTSHIDCNQLIKTAIESANREIYSLASETPELNPMGTTVTLGLRIGLELYLGHVGDSRAYLIKDGDILRLTEDHSLVASMIKAGVITEEEAKCHPDRGRIFRALGIAREVLVDTLKDEKLDLQIGDTLIFCTDGLVNYVNDDELLAEISQVDSVDAACTLLVTLANARGGEDNITTIVVKINAIEQENIHVSMSQNVCQPN